LLNYRNGEPRYRELTLELQPFPFRTPDRKGIAARLHVCAWKALAAAERVVALVLLLLLLPLLLFAGMAVFLLSGQPPLIAHARVGQGGRDLWVLKLRSMWQKGVREPAHSGFLIERLAGEPVPEVKKAGDPRVTSAFAAFCRKYSIDELPQLWHVVQGKMSLVGPRPMTIEELSQHYGHTAKEVLRFKPGLTGLWQVRGRSRLNYRQRQRLDQFLVRNWSFNLYIFLLLATIPRVLMGKDAW
jgi:exopolysaccharide production protein ExoY